MADHAKKGRPKQPATKRNNARGKKAPAPTGPKPRLWLMLLLVLLIGGAFAYFLFYIDGNANNQTEVISTPKAKKKPVVNNTPLPEVPTESWVYESLDEKEIPIDLPDQKSSKPHSYRLQCASFRTLKQAETMKAQIAFMGEEPNIKKVKGTTGNWYQVILGPYDNKRQAEASRHKMQRANINRCNILNWS
jgi:cell division protein FtsN